MKSSLAEVQEIVLPSLPPTLASPEAAARLRAQFHLLSPVACGIFECRLRADSPQVDLSQYIRRDEGEIPVLAAHLARMAAEGLADGAAWPRLSRFCAEWMDPSSPLFAHIHTIWLEFDLDGRKSAPEPSIFLSFSPAPGREAFAVAERALDILLGGPLSPAVRANTSRCFEACRGAARVSHVGAMLPRQTEALRICVSHLAADQILPYLNEIGWRGPACELEAMMARLGAFAGQIGLLDIDAGVEVQPTVALEYACRREPHATEGWAGFLGLLAGQGLCAPEKRAALLDWPGYTKPGDGPAPWPGFLLAASLLEPPDKFSMIARTLSHVKISLKPQGPPEAKAYLQFRHEFASIRARKGAG